jgi:N-acetylglutamate synthase-like GNAT family acetyltransferase/SAM-dependent methyltransferase
MSSRSLNNVAVEYRIRPARAADFESVRALLRAAALPLEGLETQFGDGYAIAEAQGSLVAVAGVERYGNDGLLRSAAVDPAWRGRGLGQALVRDRIAWARARGLDALYLLTTTAADFFRRSGFAPATRESAPEAIRASREFAQVCPSSAAFMQLPLRVLPQRSGEQLRASVRAVYGDAARRAAAGGNATCGAGSCCGPDAAAPNPITSNLYSKPEVDGLPSAALQASLGCGNPSALATLNPGEVVLDLGAGGGIDVLLSAKRVGPTGMVYGLDMTDEMLALAQSNQRRSGLANVRFLKGEIEHIPLPDESVDVVISNCVINLSAEKAQVLREAFRVLKPGGRFAVSDIVLRGELPAAARADIALWTGCVAGALQESEYRALLAAAGFTEIDVEPTRVYGEEDIKTFLAEPGAACACPGQDSAGLVMSAFIRARKP